VTPEHIYKVVSKYEIQLKARSHTAEKADTSDPNLSLKAKLNHTLWMCQEVRTFVEGNELEKANRWLGFLQGILWVNNIYTVDQMREDNRT